MNNEDLALRIERFERTVATCLCALPLLFSGQCLLVSLNGPVFSAMFSDFGAKLPWLTQFVISSWPVWALVAILVPISSLLVARKGRATFSIVFSTVSGLTMFLIAQIVTAA